MRFLIAVFRVFQADLEPCNRPVNVTVAISKPAVKPIIRALSDRDENVREGAAPALGQIEDLHAVQPLIRLLSDADEDARHWAA